MSAAGIVLVTLLSGGCDEQAGGGGSPAGDLRGRLVLTGSSTIAPLMSEIGKRFEMIHPDVRIDVQMGGSSRGVADARQGLADIGMVSRSLNDDESDLHGSLIAPAYPPSAQIFFSQP